MLFFHGCKKCGDLKTDSTFTHKILDGTKKACDIILDLIDLSGNVLEVNDFG